jgi:hypothetical protein
MAVHNPHEPSFKLKQRVSDLAIAGIPQYMIAKVIGIDEATLKKHYEFELTCAEPEAIERVSKTVVMQALNGNEKSQSLYMKTKGAKYGWVEKQIVETVNSDDLKDIKASIIDLEEKYKRDY